MRPYARVRLVRRVRFTHFRRLFDRVFGKDKTPTGTVIDRRFAGNDEFLLVVLDEPIFSADGVLTTSLWVAAFWVTEVKS